MSAADPAGLFLWYELMTPDPAAASEFFGDVMGWRVDEWDGGDSPYWMFDAGTGPVAGMMELPEEARTRGAPPHWLGYVATADVDDTHDRAMELGAEELVSPEDIPSVGRFSVFRDPLGAVIAAYTPESPPDRAGEPPEVGHFSWHELTTTDVDAAFDFYADLFGWEETGTFDMGEMGPYRMFGAHGVELGGIYRTPEEVSGPPSWLYYARVDDVEAATARVRALEGRVVHGPMEVPGGDRVAQCCDPDGAFFAVHEVVADD